MAKIGVLFSTLSALIFALAGCSSDTGTNPAPPPPPPPPGFSLAVEVAATGLDDPIHLTAPAGDARLFIVEQPGRIRIVRGGVLLETPFLDITDRVRSGGERGLFSLAFHPSYSSNGLFYVSYTDVNEDSRVERYTVSADPDVADPSSARPIVSVDQPHSNHNGGHVLFGPDGMLYVALGDGGGAGDPLGNGQNPATLLGSLLRLDVDTGDPFAIPPDNPFVGDPARRDEIWAFGLRNPWRLAFDPPTGLLYIADVGQASFEEVNVVDDDEAALNYGWSVMEGAGCFGGGSCDESGLTLPTLVYDHGEGCSVTGGLVYRGAAIPELAGHYLYSDFCAGFLRSFRFDGAGATDLREWAVGDLGPIVSFGEDGLGETYIVSGEGTVFRLIGG